MGTTAYDIMSNHMGYGAQKRYGIAVKRKNTRMRSNNEEMIG